MYIRVEICCAFSLEIFGLFARNFSQLKKGKKPHSSRSDWGNTLQSATEFLKFILNLGMALRNFAPTMQSFWLAGHVSTTLCTSALLAFRRSPTCIRIKFTEQVVGRPKPTKTFGVLIGPQKPHADAPSRPSTHRYFGIFELFQEAGFGTGLQGRRLKSRVHVLNNAVAERL